MHMRAHMSQGPHPDNPAETERGTETPIISSSASPYSPWGCLAESLAAILPVLDELEAQAGR